MQAQNPLNILIVDDEPLARDRLRALLSDLAVQLPSVSDVEFEASLAELRRAGVRDLAEVIYLTNEASLGDFGVGGMVFDQAGFQTTSELWTGSLFRERGVTAILGAHVSRVEADTIHYETLDGSSHTLDYDFAMLIPPFGGVGLDRKSVV